MSCIFGVDDGWREEYGISVDGRFLASCDHIREWSVLHEGERWPKRTSTDQYEKKLGRWMEDQRTMASGGRLRSDRIEVLDQIHPGILSYKTTMHRSEEPSLRWQAVFDAWAGETTEADVRSYRFPSIDRPYVDTAKSFKEHMVRKTKCYREFQPADCHPSKTKPGTLQDVFSYMVYPDARTRAHEQSPQPFEKNEVERLGPTCL